MDRKKIAVLVGLSTVTIVVIVIVAVYINRDTDKPRSSQKKVTFSPTNKERVFRKEESPSQHTDLEIIPEDPVTFIETSVVDSRPEMSLDRFTQRKKLPIQDCNPTVVGLNPHTINFNPIPNNFLRKRESTTPIDI